MIKKIEDHTIAKVDGITGLTPFSPTTWLINEQISISCGLHLLLAKKLGGKSISAAAFAYDTGATYIYMNEPRSRKDNVLYKLLFTESQKAQTERVLRDEPPPYLVTNEALLKSLDSTDFQVKADSFVVIDSLSENIRTAALGPSLTGGLSPGTCTFLLKLNNIAVERRIIVLATVNSEIVPKGEAFYGLCEGQWSVKTFQLEERKVELLLNTRNVRVDRFLVFSEKAVDAALTLFNIKIQKKNKNKNNKIETGF